MSHHHCIELVPCLEIGKVFFDSVGCGPGRFGRKDFRSVGQFFNGGSAGKDRAWSEVFLPFEQLFLAACQHGMREHIGSFVHFVDGIPERRLADFMAANHKLTGLCQIEPIKHG